MSEPPADSGRPSALARALAHPRLPAVAFAALASGFIALVAVYMDVAARDVAYAVRTEQAASTTLGDPAVIRVTVLRPESGRAASALARLHGPAAATIVPASAEVRSEGPTAFSVRDLPPDTSLELQVTFPDEPERRLPLGSLSAARPRSWLDGAQLRTLRASRRDATSGGISRLRVDPTSPPFELVLVADGGAPARFVENRFFLRLATTEASPGEARDTPVSGASVRVDTPRGTHALSTDALGLAEFSEVPVDLEIWTARAESELGFAEVRFEVAPTFDGLAFRPARRILAPDEPIRGALAAQRDDAVYVDVYSDAGWLAARRVDGEAGALTMPPPGGRWLNAPDGPRIALVQLYTQPFSPTPQHTVRGLVFHPPGQPEPGADAARTLLSAMEAGEVDTGYARALLTAPEALGARTPDELDRLVAYFFARLRPQLVRPARVEDDAAAQRALLDAEVGAFRRKAHWLMILGSLGLVSWMVARIGRQMHDTRSRTLAVVAEVDDPELALLRGLGANAGGGVLLLAVATATIAGFCAGVILLLTTL
jgi:hypothetical protein